MKHLSANSRHASLITKHRGVVLVAVAVLSGCVSAAQQTEAARVRVLQPRPLIDLAMSTEAMTVEIDSRVRDEFLVPEQNGITPVPVENWRSSLANGFAAGLKTFFSGTPGTAPTWRIVIVSADLDYVPTAMYSRGVAVVGAAAAIARLRYIARIIGPGGDVVGRDQGEVVSTSQWLESGGSSVTAAEAIATMYEHIAAKIPAADVSAVRAAN